MKNGLVIMLLAGLQLACSGSGDNKSISGFQYVLQSGPVVYSGNTDPAIIKGDHLWPFINYLILDDALDANSVSLKPGQANNHVSANPIKHLNNFIQKVVLREKNRARKSANRIISCEDLGSVVIVTEQLDGQSYEHYTFDNCVTVIDDEAGKAADFNLLHGELWVNETGLTSRYVFKSLNVQNQSSSYSYSGEVVVNERLLCASENEVIYNLDIKNHDSGELLRAENLLFSKGCQSGGITISGRFYHSVLGYIDITTPKPLRYGYYGAPYPTQGGEIIFTGANLQKFRLAVIHSDVYFPESEDNRITSRELLYELSLDLDGDGYFEQKFQLYPEVFLSKAGSDISDTDSDKIPDGYEVLNGLDPLTDDANFDPDGNGLTYYEEYRYQGLGVSLLVDGGNQFSNYSGIKAGKEASIYYEVMNRSGAGVRALDVIVTINLIPYDTSGKNIEILSEECELVAQLKVVCLVGDMEPDEKITRYFNFISDEAGEIEINFQAESRKMGEVYSSSYSVTTIFKNREADLHVGGDMEVSLLNEESQSQFYLKNSGPDEARNSVFQMSIPPEITVNAISMYRDRSINGIVKMDYLGECEILTQPVISCEIGHPLQYNELIKFIVLHEGKSLGNFNMTISADSDADIVEIFSEYQYWKKTISILVAKPLTPFQQKVEQSADGDKVIIPDGVYAGSIDFKGKFLLLRSENGNKNTSLWLSGEGIRLQNGGEISGFSFISPRAGISITGGEVTVKDNYVKDYDYYWLVARNANITIQNNFIDDRKRWVYGCSFDYSTIIQLINVGIFSVTNNVFFDSVKSGYPPCPTISYSQYDGQAEPVSLISGLISNNLFYSFPNRRAIALDIKAQLTTNEIYFQNNILISTATFSSSSAGDALPIIRNNLEFGAVTGLEAGYFSGDYGDSWITGLDPLFVDPEGKDFHLQLGSPAIDMGRNEFSPVNDFDYQTRPVDGNGDSASVIDIGPFEFRP